MMSLMVLDLAIEMFQGKYHRKFFNQLITSQLDVDRLDYLKRDSFLREFQKEV